MEKFLKIHQANFDYEYQLFNLPSHQIKAFSLELECLYFFTEHQPCELLTQKIYSNEYLDYVASLTGQMPQLTLTGIATPWWGSLKNIELEKKLNSKITSTTFAIQNNFAQPKTKIIHSESELAIAEERMVLKDPYQMSGRGFFRFDNGELPKAKKWAEARYPLIQEPWLAKKYDIGTYYFPKIKQLTSYLNFSNAQGNYKGTQVWSNPVEQFDVFTGLGINLDKFFANMVIIKDHYLSLGATEGFSIDSFTYQDDAQTHCYFLSEVNYRKTMGWVTCQLKKYLNQYRVGELFIHKRINTYTSVRELLKVISHNSPQQILLLSPPENQFLLFFLRANDQLELSSLENSLDNI